MSTIEHIKRAMRGLSEAELAEFRSWFVALDHVRWGEKLTNDAKHGRLDALADEALSEHDA